MLPELISAKRNDYKNLLLNDTGVIDLSSYAVSGQLATKCIPDVRVLLSRIVRLLSSESSTLFIEMLKVI